MTTLSLLYVVNADPACSKSAIVEIWPGRKSGITIYGTMKITGGKDAWQISEPALNDAFNDCFFEGGRCIVRDQLTFSCVTTYEWQSVNWIGRGKIKFDCHNSRLNHCYDAHWTRT